jgi:signal transduction histidine kinase
MGQVRHHWAFSLLWVNLAVAVVVLIQIAGNQIASTWALAQMLAYMLVYANVSGVLGILLVSTLTQKPVLRQFPQALVVPVCIILTSALGCLLAQTLLMEAGLIIPQDFWGEYFHTLRVAIPLGVVFGSGALVHASLRERVQASEAKLREKEVSEERTRKLLAEARLHSLESRIHPHFLFNTLNAVSSLISVDPPRAEHTVERLAVLLRASLDTTTQPLIPLQRELSIVESYLEIQRARFGNKLHWSVRVPAELNDAKVPPMSVQTLIENAAKHGIVPASDGGEILLTASADDNRLRIEVCDSGPGFDLTAVRAGHGLDNLVGRLDALFGPKAQLNVCRRHGHCVAEIVLPLV